jgi:predicted secreted protein
MAKCMQCGGTTKMKKMQTGGSMGIVGMPKYSNDPKTDAGRTLKKGGAVKPKMKMGGSSFGMLSVKAGVDKNPNPTAADRIAGAKMKKAKFGASVKVQHSPAPGRVRSSSGTGTVPVGMRKKTGGEMPKAQYGGLTGAELKRRGEAKKRLGNEMKVNGESSKRIGEAMKVAYMRKKSEAAYKKKNG